METGNGFNLERARSPGGEWHFQQGYHQMDNSANMMHSRMYIEKLEPTNSEMSPCSCHGCNMSRRHEPMWMQQKQWCYQSKEYLGKPPSYGEGSPGVHSPCFSVRTPVRSGERNLFCPSARMCTSGGAPSTGLGGASFRPRFLTSENQMTLHKWFLIPVKDSEVPAGGSPVAVGGFVRYGYDTEFRKTSPIIERTDKGRLKTSDGVDVRLMGCIDDEATTVNGFPASLVEFFYTGFPATWKKLLEEEKRRKLQGERVTSVDHVDKPSSPVCTGTKDAADPFTTPQATADSTLHGDDAPLDEFFEQPVCRETGKPSTPGAGEEDEIAQRCREEASHPVHNENEKLVEETARAGSRRRSSKRLPTRSSKRLKRGRGKDRGQEPDVGGQGDPMNREEQNNSERCCSGEINPSSPVDENKAVEHEPPTTAREQVDNNDERFTEQLGRKKSSSKEKEHSEQESDGSNELRDRVSVDKAERDVARVEVFSAPETVSAVSAEPVAEHASTRDVLEAVAVSQDVAEPVAELSVLEPEVDVPETAAETNQQQLASAPAGRKRTKGRAASRAGKRRKTTVKKTVKVVQEASDSKEQGNVQVPAPVEEAPALDSDPPEAPANETRKLSRRKTRKRGVCKEENKVTSVHVIEIIDSDDEAQPANVDEKQLVQSKQPEDSVVEVKPNARKPSGRTKRSSLPPPLPASRVEKSEVIEAFGLKTSRSGRLLVPPLAYWRNQTAARDRDGGIIAIMDGFKEPPSDTGYYNFKPPSEKRRLQEKLCATATDSPLRANDKGKKKIRGSK